MVMPYQVVGVGLSYRLRVLTLPFRLMDWNSRRLSQDLWTLMMRWFHALLTGRHEIPLLIQYPLLSQVSHSWPPAMRHSCPQIKDLPLMNWLMSNSKA